ncbi:hypothetical protein [Pantoea sp. KPR_PJ]|uniref:hypothetical protein n=1 Tax=Pantoea sp. KPR_PJ TaxID=2738375 RepID=UPI00352901A7
MKLHTLTDLDAAHDINQGLEYLQSKTSTRFNWQGVVDTISQGLSTGSAIASFPSSVSGKNREKIKIKNNSLCIICPTRIHATANKGQAISRTPGVLFPGDEGDFEFEYTPTANGINNGNGRFFLDLLLISVDANFSGPAEIPTDDEIPILHLEFISNRFSQLYLLHANVNGESLAPAYAPGVDQYSDNQVMTYHTFRGTEGSCEPSFGMAFFNTRAATVNVTHSTGTTSMVFTPSKKRSADPVVPLNNEGNLVWGRRAIREFLKVCAYMYFYRDYSPVQPHSFVAYTGLIDMLSSAKDIYSAISSRSNVTSTLTVNIRNLTGKNMFLLRRKFSNTMRMGNGILLDGEYCSIPLSFLPLNSNPEIFIRIPYDSENNHSVDLALTFRDTGQNGNISVHSVSLLGTDQTVVDTSHESTQEGWSNCIFSFTSYTGKHQVFVQPTKVTGRTNPAIEITVCMTETRGNLKLTNSEDSRPDVGNNNDINSTSEGTTDITDNVKSENPDERKKE